VILRKIFVYYHQNFFVHSNKTNYFYGYKLYLKVFNILIIIDIAIFLKDIQITIKIYLQYSQYINFFCCINTKIRYNPIDIKLIDQSISGQRCWVCGRGNLCYIYIYSLLYHLVCIYDVPP